MPTIIKKRLFNVKAKKQKRKKVLLLWTEYRWDVEFISWLAQKQDIANSRGKMNLGSGAPKDWLFLVIDCGFYRWLFVLLLYYESDASISWTYSHVTPLLSRAFHSPKFHKNPFAFYVHLKKIYNTSLIWWYKLVLIKYVF